MTELKRPEEGDVYFLEPSATRISRNAFGRLVLTIGGGVEEFEDVHALALQVSVPESIEAFVHARLPGARRVEMCHDQERIVVRRGWQPLGAACVPVAGDEVISLL